MRNLESDNYWCAGSSCSVCCLSQPVAFFWPFPHQPVTILQLQAMCYLHWQVCKEEMAGRQFPDISISVSGKANIFSGNSLADACLCLFGQKWSLAISLCWSGRWQEKKMTGKDSWVSFNKPWGMVLICYDSEESNSNKQIAIVIASTCQTWHVRDCVSSLHLLLFNPHPNLV